MPFAKFHQTINNFIGKEAIKKGYDPNNREILQRTGVELISAGWESFCQSVLQDAKWINGEGIVVDGIRHIEGLITIKKIVFPLEVYLIYVLLDEDVRTARLLGRQVDIQELHSLEKHSTEIQVKDILLNSANLIVSGIEDVETNVNIIINYLSI